MTLNICTERLSHRIENQAVRRPTVPGRIKTYVGDRLKQNFQYTLPVHFFNIRHGIDNQRDANMLLDHWYVINFTPYEGFIFRDVTDYRATQTNSSLQSIDGSETVFQLCRKHVFGSIAFNRPIYRPWVDGLLVYRIRDEDPPDEIAATVDYTNGSVTIADHEEGDTYVWEGIFDLQMTYKENEWATTLETGNGSILHLPDAIEIEEVRG